jgi:hypothetical protein
MPHLRVRIRIRAPGTPLGQMEHSSSALSAGRDTWDDCTKRAVREAMHLMNAGEQPSVDRMLRSLRLEAGLSQETPAERAGLSVRGIQDLERATRPHKETHTA